MNYRMIRYVVFWTLKIEGLFMLLPVIAGLVYGEFIESLVYFAAALAYYFLGHVFSRKRPKNTSIYAKEGFAAVALCWITMSLFGAFPFTVIGDIPSYVDALFEIVSGFTTTGASILTDIEALSHASLFWRSFSHWLGGMGVLVFALMILPVKDGSQMQLLRAESPGPDVSKFVPKIRDTAILLYKIYIVITASEMLILFLSGMNIFDTICISFGTAGTGGFGVLNSSCASYTVVQQWIITVFMILFGVNFSFYYFIICKKLGSAVRMEEVRVYICVLIASIVLIAINIASVYDRISDAFLEAAFHVGSIMTTTGFAISDFNLWPAFSKTLLVVLMFCGACAGSTGGGIKVSRIIIIIKSVGREIYFTLHPKRYQSIRLDGKVVSDRERHSVSVYIIAFLLVFTFSLIIISLDGHSFETNFTAVAATINNIGPGLGDVGPVGNYVGFSLISKLVLIFDMLAGRLEVLPMLVFITPMMWSRKSS